MNRELLIEHTPNLIRAAVIEDGKLCEIHQERVKGQKLTESLFLGRVQSIRPSVGAAFIDIGQPLNAFLPLGENSLLRCGDFVIVQGTAVQAVETKGLRVSDSLNLAGKWLVLVPGGQGVRLSKKIKDPALRDLLMQAVSPMCPDGCGLIVRTASGDVTQEALACEAQELAECWREIQRRAKGMTKPGILHEPPDLGMQLVRDIGSTLLRVTTNSAQVGVQLLSARENGWLGAQTEIRRFDEAQQLMADAYSLEPQVDKALRRRVWLDCGGYLIFDCCEAMTVIDVNSGKMTLGRDTEDTALRVNLEAAREIARQLRLRDIGGMVIVDYIDMKFAEHRELLLAEIKKACALDRAKVSVLGLTRLGLVEMTRTRRGEQLDRTLQATCKACGGDGRFLSPQETALRALRQLRRMAISGQRGPFLISCSAPAAHTLGELVSPLGDTPVYVLAENGRHADRFEIKQLDIAAKPPKGAEQLKKG